MKPVTASTVFHVIPLSNFARGYDKYAGVYDKSGVGESRFKDRFFVLDVSELAIGFDKTAELVKRIGLDGDAMLVLRGEVEPGRLMLNLETGRGRYFETTKLPITELFMLDGGNILRPISVEEAYAASLKVANPTLIPYADLKPRTLSVLPVARACQASCKFCFSESSASLEQFPRFIPLSRIESLAKLAREHADRFVITGGGEPGIMPHGHLLNLIRIGSDYFRKTVLITNGFHLAKRPAREREAMLHDYGQFGLSVLSISRHHWDDLANAEIMGLDTRTSEVVDTWWEGRFGWLALNLRLICVLQRGGVEDSNGVAAYLDWAAARDVEEVCFKELYVSSTLESAYHDRPENAWSREHQVPLSMLVSFLEEKGFVVTSKLPWGSPVYAGIWAGKPMRVAAYTEPSLHWERSNGIARSWNIMSDGSCLASLEDPSSRVHDGENVA